VKGNEIEELLEHLTDAIVADVEALPEAKAPFGQVRLTREQQMMRYLRERDDPAAWAKRLSEQGLDATLAYARAMERVVSHG